MKVSEAIALYTRHKHLRGVHFDKGQVCLQTFCRSIRNKEISCVTAGEVRQFLGSPKLATPSWRARHMTLGKFLEFWSLRGEMPPIGMPLLPKAIESDFVPYVYSKGEVRALVRAASKLYSPNPLSVEPKTLRALILTLYATGAFLGQVLSLQRADVDLDGGFISFMEGRYQRTRTVPIAKDLLQVLRRHAKRQVGRPQQFFFSTPQGGRITAQSMTVRFRRIRKLAGLHRPGGVRGQPRLHDLRATFAVHRINEWLRKGLDLNRMLPALSAYMGLMGLMRSERYLRLAPERFRKELDKLSPLRRNRHWRDDPALMKFLAEL